MTAAGKPLVLTPEEFAKLTAQGVLKFNPPAKPDSNNRTSKVLSPPVPTATLPITPGPAPNKTPAMQALSFKNSLSLQHPDMDVSTCSNLKLEQIEKLKMMLVVKGHVLWFDVHVLR